MDEEVKEPTTEVIEEKAIKVKSNSIAATGWKPNATSVEDQYRLATLYVKSKMLPSRFNTPESAMVALQFAAEHFEKPLTAVRQIAVIEGTPCMYGDLPLALVRGSGKCLKMEEYYIDSAGQRLNPPDVTLENLFGAVCKVQRKDTGDIVDICFTKKDAEKAGLYPSGNPRSAWAKYPKIMFKMRARSQALKDGFSDVLNGVAIAEYDIENFNMEEKDVSPNVVDKAALINDSFNRPNSLQNKDVQGDQP